MQLSFIIPTFNRGYCIENTVRSISFQQREGTEIIVIDDGSTDNTATVIRQFPEVIYRKLSKNSGVNIAKNQGASLAKGKWLVFLDSDDLLNQNGLEIIKSVLNSTEEQYSIYFFKCKSISGNPISNIDYDGHLTYELFFREHVKGEYLPVVKREVFLDNTFETSIIGGEGLTWRKIAKPDGVYYCNKPVRVYNDIAKDRLSNKNWSFYKRLHQIYVFDLTENYGEYLKTSKTLFIIKFLKMGYYFLRKQYIQIIEKGFKKQVNI